MEHIFKNKALNFRVKHFFNLFKVITSGLFLFITTNLLAQAPIITSFTPTNGVVGATVTLTGTGFNTTAASNIVFFGATRATVTAASATSMTVTVPAGATFAPITVLNTGTVLAAYSLANFNPIYSPAKTNLTTADFNPKQDFTTGTGPISMAIGDLDGDGKPDLAVANQFSNTVSVYRNTSSSGSIAANSFAAKVDFATGNQPLSVAIGDLDGDGKLDLAVANNNSGTVSVFRNTSTLGNIAANSFAAKIDFTTGADWGSNSVAIGDLNGDGKLDLAVSNFTVDRVSVFRNTSSIGSIVVGSFAAKVDFVTGDGARSVAIGDLDGDGKPDLAVANLFSNNLSVFRNLSSSGSIIEGSFAAKVDFETGAGPRSISIGDLDGDGKSDLVIANGGSSNTVSVFHNTSTSGSIAAGSFAAKVDFTTGNGSFILAIGDLNGDGKPDLAVTNQTANSVSIFRNTSTSGSIVAGSFATKVDFTTGTGPRPVAIGDLDGDGKPDLAVANFNSTSVSVFRNLDVLSSNADLSALAINAGTLTPTFAAATTAYTASVTNETTSITVTPTRADANATIQVRINGGTFVAVTSGSASSAQSLNVGANPIDVRVTAQNGTTIKTYTITVTRAAANTWVGSNGDFNNGSNWSLGTPTADQTLVINTGNVTMTADFNVQGSLTLGGSGTLTVSPNATLTVTGGQLVTGTNSLIFKSTAVGSGLLGNITNGGSVSGTNVTTERFIPAKRAFRFLSPSVTTTSSINANWQENTGSTANLGTHITGTGGANNGFDASTTNNASLFVYTSGSWQAVTNTNANTLTAGTGYRLMVRGDRTVNLASNTPTATTTVLRATGTLITGNHSATINQIANGLSFVGNPYQAPVDIKSVFNASSNMNTGVVYYWDPTINVRGGYVTRDLTVNANVPASNFNEFVQPGQAVFVKRDNTANVATLTFAETNKSVVNASAGLFRTSIIPSNNISALRLKLKTTIDNQLQEVDGVLALFDTSYSWDVNEQDAPKLSNLDEQVSFKINNQNIAIASQSIPVIANELPIDLRNFRQANYQWHFELENYNGATPYLLDTQNQSYTEIQNGTSYNFSVNVQSPTSYAARFKVVFANNTLSNPRFDKNIVLYPNPADNGNNQFFIQGVEPTAKVAIYNILGQPIAIQTTEQVNGLQVQVLDTIATGIYVVTVTTPTTKTQVKWIVK